VHASDSAAEPEAGSDARSAPQELRPARFGGPDNTDQVTASPARGEWEVDEHTYLDEGHPPTCRHWNPAQDRRAIRFLMALDDADEATTIERWWKASNYDWRHMVRRLAANARKVNGIDLDHV
jgi:hypothetical protein